MKYNATFLFLLLLAAQVITAQTTDPFLPDSSGPSVVGGKSLVWNDEFNVEGKPNSANWKYETGFVRNQELQYYQSANVNCVGGVCLFTGKRDTVVNTKFVSGSTDWRYKNPYAYWTSGSIISQGLKTFLYGQIEIRARIDTTLGSWPAIWTKGVSGSWPNCGETDIMEFYFKNGAKTIFANVAWGSASYPTVGTWNTKTKALSYFLAKDANWCEKFHIWKECWNKDTLKLYLDNELLNTQLLANTINASGITPVNPHKQAHFYLLNLAIGANGGTPTSTTSAYRYEVDYIRVYQDTPTTIEAPSKDEIQVYPNPVSDVLHVASNHEIIQLSIMDLVGKQILNQSNPRQDISVMSLKPGVYTVILTVKDEPAFLRRLIKR